MSTKLNTHSSDSDSNPNNNHIVINNHNNLNQINVLPNNIYFQENSNSISYLGGQSSETENKSDDNNVFTINNPQSSSSGSQKTSLLFQLVLFMASSMTILNLEIA